MLNISPNRIDGKFDKALYHSFSMVRDYRAARIFSRLMTIFFIVFLLVLFLPWTQNIRSKGTVTTLLPDHRPQTVHSVIAGRIENWYVREGDFVAKGDTILYITEVKDDYFDPELLSRTQQQIDAKGLSVSAYKEKVRALDNQILALRNTLKLKTEQSTNYVRQSQLKVQSDSIDFQAAQTNLDIAEKQLARMEQLYKDGLKSLTDFESRRMKYQEALAKKISAENKLLSSRNDLINAKIELNSIEAQYKDKLSKAESEKFATISNRFDAEASLTKMENQYANYAVRKGYYYITAPQDGYITQAIRTGIGETIKEGEQLLSIMPSRYELAVAMYVNPIDLPLISKGQKVRFMFDGWPSVVFSGWPGVSFGTFGGKVMAIDNFISNNGKYRILVAPDPDDQDWPEALRVGGGANGIALLKDVPIWYEIWRKLNGFPPDYYKFEDKPKTMAKDK